VREAYDASMGRNDVVKLEVPMPDRFENAWKRVVLGWGSKADIVKLCSVGDGTIAKMRRVKARYDGGHGEQLMRSFHEALVAQAQTERLDQVTWAKAHGVWLGFGEKEITKREAASKLARSLRSRMTDRLSRDPEITAQALAIYDPELPEPMLGGLQRVIDQQMSEEGETDGEGQTAFSRTVRHDSTDELKEWRRVYRIRLSDIESEIGRRRYATRDS
jgi:hypothetical protein